MVSDVRFKLHRTIVAYAKTGRGDKKEFKDKQQVMYGRFEDQVASKEPRRINRDYAILLKPVQGSNTEKNRLLMLTDFETGHPMPFNLRKMQHDILPSIDTPNIKISYEIETIISHEGMFSPS